MANNVFTGILAGTPTWVWGILAFLIYRGVVMAQDREVKMRSFIILPIAMVIWSFTSVLGATQVTASILAWTLGLSGAALLSKQWTSSSQFAAGSETGMLWVKGSWTPLVLMMSIFVAKFIWNISLFAVEGLKQNPTAWMLSSLVFGAMSGVFLGRALKAVQRQSVQAQTHMA